MAAGASTSFGFNGAWNGSSNPAPTSFRLNGITCGGATATTEPTTSAPPTTRPPTTRPPTTQPPTTQPPTTQPPTTQPPGIPPTQTVRVFWLRPSVVPFDQRCPDGITKVMVEAQRYYKQELGKTFRLNSPTVEVVVGEHVKSWYENTPAGGDRYWWSVTNMQNELVRRMGVRVGDKRWLNVGEISAEGEGAGGGGGNGWVVLCQHDADGAATASGQAMNRWYGGMVHELGHAVGLPDSTSTDGTPMSASFYDYPNTHFSQSQKNAILNGPYGNFLF
jgi:hypothetical protein